MKKRKEKDINRLFNILGWHPEPVDSLNEAAEMSEQEKPVERVKIGPCGKTSYTSQSAVKKAIRHRLNKGANVSRLRSYHCDKCGLWHMTSSF